MFTRDQCIKEFENRFSKAPAFVLRAPGRVNLIGEHTDYNDGFVLPVAIDMAVWIAFRATFSQHVTVHSINLGETASFSLDSIKRGDQGWAEYIKGIAYTLGQAGYPLRGWEGLLASDVPIGAGLASSAALEIAVIRAFSAVSGFPWEPIEMAHIGQRVERDWIGVNCGIMDQMIAAMGREGYGVLIDCRSLKTLSIPLPPDATIVVLDTSTRRGLTDSAYNERRKQCSEAARLLGVAALRDVSHADLYAQADKLSPVLYKRARHVTTENIRTLKVVGALRHRNVVRAGELLNESHASLRDDFEVSCPELDQIVAFAQMESSCYGARMTGAGFGGCAVALVRTDAAQDFTNRVAAKYREATGLDPRAYICASADGVTLDTL